MSCVVSPCVNRLAGLVAVRQGVKRRTTVLRSDGKALPDNGLVNLESPCWQARAYGRGRTSADVKMTQLRGDRLFRFKSKRRSASAQASGFRVGFKIGRETLLQELAFERQRDGNIDGEILVWPEARGRQ